MTDMHIDLLTPSAGHRIDDRTADWLATSIQVNGIECPIKITADGLVLDGHHRLAAAQMLGIETVPIEIERQD